MRNADWAPDAYVMHLSAGGAMSLRGKMKNSGQCRLTNNTRRCMALMNG